MSANKEKTALSKTNKKDHMKNKKTKKNNHCFGQAKFLVEVAYLRVLVQVESAGKVRHNRIFAMKILGNKKSFRKHPKA